jgi:hypothetical protein
MLPKPNSARAAWSRRAFFSVGSTNTSRSSVNLGSAWIAIACPPIKRNRVPVEISTRKNSFQSSFRRKVAEPLLAKPLDGHETLFRGALREVFAVKLLAFFEIRDADDTLHAHRPQHA